MASESSLIVELEPVNPGDLITAGFVNNLIAALWELDDRVSALESENQYVAAENEEAPAPQTKLVVSFVRAESDGDTAQFEVIGSGLEPTGIKRFKVNDEPVKHSGLTGDDEEIHFSAIVKGLSGGSKFPIGGVGGARSGGGKSRNVLTVETKAGAKASRSITVETDDKR